MENELTRVSEVQKQKQGSLGVFSDADSFGLAMNMAGWLAKSTIVPKSYQNNPSNCLIAIEMASRINTSPMMVMQNLYIVNGTPAWSSQWIIAMINNSRRYKTELKFDIKYDNNGSLVSCMAWAEDYNGNKVTGPIITMQMARDEGWIGKSGSKWKTMPEVMIRYRAASFFGRLNCPDMIMGIYSQEEVIDGFGDVLDDTTAGAVAEAEVVDDEKDRIVTQEERQKFMQVISDNFDTKEKKNSVFFEVLEEFGLKSTSKMTVSQLDKAIEMVLQKAKEEANPGENNDTEEQSNKD